MSYLATCPLTTPSRPVTSSHDDQSRPVMSSHRSVTTSHIHLQVWLVRIHVHPLPIKTSHVQTSRSVVSSHVKTWPFTTLHDQSRSVTPSYMHVVAVHMSINNPITTCHVQTSQPVTTSHNQSQAYHVQSQPATGKACLTTCPPTPPSRPVTGMTCPTADARQAQSKRM